MELGSSDLSGADLSQSRLAARCLAERRKRLEVRGRGVLPGSSSDERPKCLKVPLVERVDLDRSFGFALRLRGLEEHRRLPEPPVVDEAAERLEADVPFADVRVPIDAAAERLLRIVHMEGAQPGEPDCTTEPLERRGVAFRGGQVVPGREQMTGIEADAEPAVAAHQLDDRRELL